MSPTLYSLLIKNSFKIPNAGNQMYLRGYLACFVGNCIENKEELEQINDWFTLYADEQYRKLFERLRKNGHVQIK